MDIVKRLTARCLPSRVQTKLMIQCAERGIAIGPIASFNKWKDRGRFCAEKTKGDCAVDANHVQADARTNSR